MPVYCFTCVVCKRTREEVRSMDEVPASVPCECGGEMYRDYRMELCNPHVWKADWWDIDLNPVWIESRQQLFEECKKRDLVPWFYDKVPKNRRTVWKGK